MKKFNIFFLFSPLPPHHHCRLPSSFPCVSSHFSSSAVFCENNIQFQKVITFQSIFLAFSVNKAQSLSLSLHLYLSLFVYEIISSLSTYSAITCLIASTYCMNVCMCVCTVHTWNFSLFGALTLPKSLLCNNFHIQKKHTYNSMNVLVSAMGIYSWGFIYARCNNGNLKDFSFSISC